MEKRAVCLNCIDGRVQLPVIRWIQNNHGADYVDMVTEPGMDGLLAGADNLIADVCKKARLSIERNHASLIVIAGHSDCRGNPVSDQEHHAHIRSAVNRLRKEIADINIIGLWIDAAWQGNLIE